jgi:hypothetical protein
MLLATIPLWQAIALVALIYICFLFLGVCLFVWACGGYEDPLDLPMGSQPVCHRTARDASSSPQARDHTIPRRRSAVTPGDSLEPLGHARFREPWEVVSYQHPSHTVRRSLR